MSYIFAEVFAFDHRSLVPPFQRLLNVNKQFPKKIGENVNSGTAIVLSGPAVSQLICLEYSRFMEPAIQIICCKGGTGWEETSKTRSLKFKSFVYNADMIIRK